MLQSHSVASETDVSQDWLGMLDEYAVQFVALDRHGDSDLVELFRSQPGWIVDLEDGEAVLFVLSDH